MRKLTALTVALSLSAAGQAFAGEAHTTHAAPSHVVAPVKEKLEVTKAVGKAVEREIIENANPQQVNEFENKAYQAKHQAEQKLQPKAQQDEANIQAIKSGSSNENSPTNFWFQNVLLPVGALRALAGGATEIKAKIGDAEMTEAKKTQVTDTANTLETADAPNSGGANAAGTAESQNTAGK